MRLLTTCLDDDEVLLLLQNGLPAGLRAQVDSHLDSCEACRHLVAVAADPGLVSQREPALTADEINKVNSPRVDLARGTTIDRYLVLGLIGAGGMSRVYLAYDPELDRRVALKLLDPTQDRESLRSRLVREAKALGKLSHPNVVQVYDVGQYPGGVFVAMELVDGVSFEVWCRQPPRPPWQDVLAAYLEAAQGLSAAHQAGLVHRDVKPSNLLRGQDGRVRVADFGLALGAEGSERSGPATQEPRPPAYLAATLTSTGARVGTPMYMAPEQHQSSRATAASDQYSFCVALYEGLYGVLPFPLTSRGSFEELLGELAKAKSAGELAPRPSNSPVPSWVHQVLVRGLAVVPRARHPSMEALISALRDDPVVRQRGRRWRLGVGLGGAAVLAFALAGWAQSGAFRDPCAHPESELVGVWDASTRNRIRTAFEGTHRDYAQASLQTVTDLLGTYADDWTQMRGEVCRLYQSKPQRSEDREAREVCLDRRLGQLRALTTLLAEKSDPAVLNKAVSAAGNLVPVSECADVAALRARVPPPEGPELRAKVSALQPEVDRLEALIASGHFPEVLDGGAALLKEVRAVPYPELTAQTHWWIGQAQARAGDYDAAKAAFQEAANEAAEARDVNLLAQSWGQVLYLTTEYQMKFDEAAVLLRLRPTLLAGTTDERATWLWQTAEGYLLMETGKFHEARKSLEQALAIAEKIWARRASRSRPRSTAWPSRSSVRASSRTPSRSISGCCRFESARWVKTTRMWGRRWPTWAWPWLSTATSPRRWWPTGARWSSSRTRWGPRAPTRPSCSTTSATRSSRPASGKRRPRPTSTPSPSARRSWAQSIRTWRCPSSTWATSTSTRAPPPRRSRFTSAPARSRRRAWVQTTPTWACRWRGWVAPRSGWATRTRRRACWSERRRCVSRCMSATTTP